jgi:N-hydroxyarylamine O-acetyltransferase
MSNDFRLNSYLARIGFGGTVGPDFATLAAIHAAHIQAIENFDPLLRRPVKLDLAKEIYLEPPSWRLPSV